MKSGVAVETHLQILRKVTTSLSPSKQNKTNIRPVKGWKGIGLAEGSPADYLEYFLAKSQILEGI